MEKWIFIFSFSLNLFAADFDGYIIKLRNQKSLDNLKTRLGQDAESLNLSFGNFLVYRGPENKINKAVLNDPNIEYMEPNYLYKEIDSQKENGERISDEFFNKQWGLKNTGNNARGTVFETPKKGIDTNAIAAWEITKGNKEIVIGVLDSGVLFDHPDLKENMWINEEEANGLPGVDDDFNGIIDDFNGFYDVKTSKTNTPTDKNGHGTHISGIIGMSHNGIGGRGVMDKVKIMPLKIKIDTDYSYPMDVTLRAIDYAIKKKVTILTTSIGDYENSKAFEEAIRNVIKNNIPFVCACGNSNDNLDRKKVYPPSYVETIPEIIVVCDHGPSGKKDYLSNYGKKTVTIMAPGTQIYSSYVTLKEVSPGRKGPDYSMESGSSMAAPFVTGAIGLLLSNEPNLTPAEIKERIVKTAKKENQLKGYSQSGGRLDIYRLLQNIEN